ncbi:hypothetical protein F4778DRAFT_725464 [Xylariomycetidae sp. FL2044]|nr:hypothetical protein F4778DRAFT_725464 [Xylariomycetidae sp. FL2044]
MSLYLHHRHHDSRNIPSSFPFVLHPSSQPATIAMQLIKLTVLLGAFVPSIVSAPAPTASSTPTSTAIPLDQLSQPCQPGTYVCGLVHDGRNIKSAVYVCTPLGYYKLSAECGDYHCCASDYVSAYCLC